MRRAPTESDEDRIRKLLEALGQPPTSRPPATRSASDRYSTPASCAGAAADFTVFATKTRKVAQARDNHERNSGASACRGHGENGSTRLEESGKIGFRLRRGRS